MRLGCVPDITNDERGRRVFQIHKESAVESAIEKIRLKLGQDWKLFSSTEVDALKYLLGEVWVSVGRGMWEGYSFTRLTKKELDGIISAGKEAKRGDISEQVAIKQAVKILDAIT